MWSINQLNWSGNQSIRYGKSVRRTDDEVKLVKLYITRRPIRLSLQTIKPVHTSEVHYECWHTLHSFISSLSLFFIKLMPAVIIIIIFPERKSQDFKYYKKIVKLEWRLIRSTIKTVVQQNRIKALHRHRQTLEQKNSHGHRQIASRCFCQDRQLVCLPPR